MTQKKDITIHDIAAELKLSSSTVSRALQNNERISKKTREKVWAYANENGYRPNLLASNLRTKKTKTLGVVVPRIDRNYLSSIISGIEEKATEFGYNVMIAQSGEKLSKEKSIVQTMFHQRVDGLLVSLSMETSDIDHFRLFKENNIPLLFFDRVPKDTTQDRIHVDDFSGSYFVVEHLIKKGKPKIAFINGSTSIDLYSERLRGLKEALQDHNISFDKKYYFETDLTFESGTHYADKLFSLCDEIDAIYCANDTAAVAVMMEAKRRGISIPKDVSIAGFSNEPFSMLVTPTLTTVAQPGRRLGKKACEQLMQLLGSTNVKTAPLDLILPTELIVRDSS